MCSLQNVVPVGFLCPLTNPLTISRQPLSRGSLSRSLSLLSLSLCRALSPRLDFSITWSLFSVERVLCRMCSIQNIFSTERVLCRMGSLQNISSRTCSLEHVFSTEYVLYRTCSLEHMSSQNIFSVERVFRLYLPVKEHGGMYVCERVSVYVSILVCLHCNCPC